MLTQQDNITIAIYDGTTPVSDDDLLLALSGTQSHLYGVELPLVEWSPMMADLIGIGHNTEL